MLMVNWTSNLNVGNWSKLLKLNGTGRTDYNLLGNHSYALGFAGSDVWASTITRLNVAIRGFGFVLITVKYPEQCVVFEIQNA